MTNIAARGTAAHTNYRTAQTIMLVTLSTVSGVRARDIAGEGGAEALEGLVAGGFAEVTGWRGTVSLTPRGWTMAASLLRVASEHFSAVMI
jgi:hypothetical protein